MMPRYQLVIERGCPRCGRCSHILTGWPDLYLEVGLQLGRWAVEEHSAAIDKLIASCPLDLIALQEINHQETKHEATSHGR